MNKNRHKCIVGYLSTFDKAVESISTFKGNKVGTFLYNPVKMNQARFKNRKPEDIFDEVIYDYDIEKDVRIFDPQIYMNLSEVKEPTILYVDEWLECAYRDDNPFKVNPDALPVLIKTLENENITMIMCSVDEFIPEEIRDYFTTEIIEGDNPTIYKIDV
ncbi:MAG: hypothetical protein QM632_06515 [Micrococcaceae bacterium]